MLAPLAIFVYKREDTTQRMLEAINRNTLADKTEVFIFSDGPKTEADADKVDKVRKLIWSFKEQCNFRKVTIIEQKQNLGLANSIISGVSKLISEYGKVIVVEDDLITATNFLSFMNDCLDYYENNNKIWSIGGTTYELPHLKNYNHDIYVSYRGESCGWATWENRWDKVAWDVPDYKTFMKDRKAKKKFKRAGQDAVSSLTRQMKGETDSWAIRWCYYESKNDMLTILPKKSFVANIGWGEESTHCNAIDIFHTCISSENFQYNLENVDIDNALIKDFLKYFSKPMFRRIMDYIYLLLIRLRNF